MPDHANEQGGPYRVGYRRPPKKSQFKKGQSGNPKGRPPKKAVSIDVDALLFETIEVNRSGKPLKMAQREVGLRRFLKRAVEEKHLPSIRYLLECFQRYGAISPRSLETGGVIVLPSTMPWQMALLLFEKFGRPPWTGAQKAVGRKTYLEGRSDIDRKVDELAHYEDL